MAMMPHDAWIWLAEQARAGKPMSDGMARLAKEAEEYLKPLEAEEDLWGDWYCPRCAETIKWGTEWCPSCGQKLSYGDET